jgi:hypothetical protein
MNEPVPSVLRVGVTQLSGTVVRQLDAADLVEAQLLGLLVAVQRVDVEAVLDVLDQRPAVRVVCLIASFWRGRSGSLVIQQIIASMSWLGFGAFLTGRSCRRG